MCYTPRGAQAVSKAAYYQHVGSPCSHSMLTQLGCWCCCCWCCCRRRSRRRRRRRRRGADWVPSAVFCLGRYSALLEKKNRRVYQVWCNLAAKLPISPGSALCILFVTLGYEDAIRDTRMVEFTPTFGPALDLVAPTSQTSQTDY